MAYGLGRMPVKAEVTTGYREISGNGQLFPAPRTEQGAVVSDA
jgi:hypothetical protein